MTGKHASGSRIAAASIVSRARQSDAREEVFVSSDFVPHSGLPGQFVSSM